MRALTCRAFGDLADLEVAELPDPEPGPDQVVIDVHACGVNFPDMLIVKGEYQFKPPLPFSPGAEVAGTIAAVGSEVTGFAPGDRVAAVALWGGMAERMAVDAAAVTRLPDSADLIAVAALLMAHGTAHHALFDRAGLAAGETLLVLGAGGGVGLAAVQCGVASGARVIAAASSDEKLRRCFDEGAQDVVDLRSQNLRDTVKGLTNGRGVDVCVDTVGGEFAEPAVRSMAWRGRYLVVGFAAGEIPRIPLNLPLLKGCSITGVFWGAFREKEPAASAAQAAELLAKLDAGTLRPLISDVLPLDRATEALRAIEARRAVGKLVIAVKTPPSEDTAKAADRPLAP